MKKSSNAVCLIALVSLLSAGLFSCGETSSGAFYSLDAAYINPKTGLVHRADKDGNIITSSYASGPFDTDISLIYYGEAGMKQDADFETAFSYSFQHYHALYDRHYYYVENGSFVNNVKVINDAYGTGKAVKLDSDLYASLK